MNEKPKRLCKSSTDKKIFGVCAGIADYFNIDPTILRIIWLALVLLYGTGVLLYIICAIILPEAPTKYNSEDYKNIYNDKTRDIDLVVEAEEVEVVTEESKE